MLSKLRTNLVSYPTAVSDVKYENVLFTTANEQSEIKLIDFGLSKKYGKDEELMEGVGTM